jgi:hypothetical protein
MDASAWAWPAALWLGVLTSLSPCPLATNVTAVSYIGRLVGLPRRVLSAGLLYTAGRAAAYILLCSAVTWGLLAVPAVSFFLQKRMNQFLGPLLLLTGLFLAFAERLAFSGAGGNFAALAKTWADKGSHWGAAPMGFLFALALCPVSAALLFGSLLPLAVKHGSAVALPAVYGAGTAVPAVIVAGALAWGGGAVGRAFGRMSAIERWARRGTAGLFVLVGGYLTLVHVFGVGSGR